MGPRTPDDEDIFFPPKGRGDLTQKAKAICNACPVKKQCESYQGDTGSDYGVWFGTTRSDRSRSKKWL
ncbi:WhiB-like transcriptional regulator [Rhodococcus phage Mbo2]|uniref:WhiB-like transcriptional regulator n=1 Tax=Rhodococcus phage Mbo2 TaxID=2936911 RepID=A0A9E7LH53_9CAUD|nr:WhiB-like transcriptional regulator [Rhodococcus phage Mbo2]